MGKIVKVFWCNLNDKILENIIFITQVNLLITEKCPNNKYWQTFSEFLGQCIDFSFWILKIKNIPLAGMTSVYSCAETWRWT